MIEKEAVPTSPHPEQLSIFSQRFSNSEQVESAITNYVPALVPLDTIETLRGLQVSLSKLGIIRWAPNIDKQPDSLSNEACRISALKTFRKLVIGGAYVFMNIRMGYVNDLDLLTKTYDHYVHFYMAGIDRKEVNEKGTRQKKKERDALQKGRERLRDLQYKFAIRNDFPKQYQRILKPVQAHSDEEFYEEKEIYIA
ncbi:hypothetical protein O181_096662 [Austropuccinia psidii MF-1]|uniref:Uncharacterized protein n=1 Tax=Austropuccinia psidii MF-1 TaxID=1389203 RepID=A0A9Q3J726_9BASI|nr:hypothetical protein [Austropuccinia psidii MF-1]